MKKEFVEFSEIKQALMAEKELITELDKFQKVIAITRGGLSVAGLLSQHLDTRYYDTACVQSYTDTKEQDVLEVLKVEPTEEEVLLVEDKVDSGKTIQFLKKYYPNSKVFTLHYDPDNSVVEPDYYLWETNAWIVYPWELE